MPRRLLHQSQSAGRGFERSAPSRTLISPPLPHITCRTGSAGLAASETGLSGLRTDVAGLRLDSREQPQDAWAPQAHAPTAKKIPVRAATFSAGFAPTPPRAPTSLLADGIKACAMAEGKHGATEAAAGPELADAGFQRLGSAPAAACLIPGQSAGHVAPRTPRGFFISAFSPRGRNTGSTGGLPLLAAHCSAVQIPPAHWSQGTSPMIESPPPLTAAP